MKCFFTLLFCAITSQTIGQSSLPKDERKNAFLFFTGVSIHSAYKGFNLDRALFNSSLNEVISPGFEFGFRYRRTLLPRLYGCVSLGGNYAVIRNKIVTEYQSTRGFISNEHYYGFLEGGLCYRTEIFKNGYQVFFGYRLNQVLTATYGYGESDPEYMFGIESTVNPATKSFPSIVIRPEFVINAGKSKRKLIIGIQGVVGAYRSDFVEGTYFYKSDAVDATGSVRSDFAHLTVLGQIYL